MSFFTSGRKSEKEMNSVDKLIHASIANLSILIHGVVYKLLHIAKAVI
jgi:hypothetical protein